MKKLFAILAIAFVFTACNNATEEAAAPVSTDTSNPAADALKDAEAANAALDTTKTKETAPLDTIKDGLKKVGAGIKEGTKEVANKVAEGAKEVGKDVKNAANKVVEKTKEAVKN